MSEKWGVGKEKDSKAFDTTIVGEREVELIHGEFPHSRRDNTTYARWSDGRVEGFDGHRLLHEIRFKDYNYLKTSELSGNQVRKGGQCDILINGVVVESFFYRDVQWAMSEAQHKLRNIHDFPVRLWDKRDRENLIGRKVYYREMPAIITRCIEDQACVIIEPDGNDKFPMAPFEIEDAKEGGTIYDEYETSIKESIYSPHIWWWRSNKKGE